MKTTEKLISVDDNREPLTQEQIELLKNTPKKVLDKYTKVEKNYVIKAVWKL